MFGLLSSSPIFNRRYVEMDEFLLDGGKVSRNVEQSTTHKQTKMRKNRIGETLNWNRKSCSSKCDDKIVEIVHMDLISFTVSPVFPRFLLLGRSTRHEHMQKLQTVVASLKNERSRIFHLFALSMKNSCFYMPSAGSSPSHIFDISTMLFYAIEIKLTSDVWWCSLGALALDIIENFWTLVTSSSSTQLSWSQNPRAD